MDYKEVENYFDTPTSLENLLTTCNALYFSKIESYSELLNKNGISHGTDYVKILNELTSIYIALKPILAIASTKKDHQELAYYIKRKREIENAGEKFISAPIEKEASLEVASYRRIRNIVEAYLESTIQTITSCQSILKFLSEEMKLSK